MPHLKTGRRDRLKKKVAAEFLAWVEPRCSKTHRDFIQHLMCARSADSSAQACCEFCHVYRRSVAAKKEMCAGREERQMIVRESVHMDLGRPIAFRSCPDSQS